MAAFLETPIGQWVGIILSVLTGGVGQTMMKLGTQRVGEFGEIPALQYIFRLLTHPFILVAIMAYGLGVILYMLILSRTDLSYLYPVMTALGLVLATLISSFILGEEISVLRLSGIGIVILGVFMISQT